MSCSASEGSGDSVAPVESSVVMPVDLPIVLPVEPPIVLPRKVRFEGQVVAKGVLSLTRGKGPEVQYQMGFEGQLSVEGELSLDRLPVCEAPARELPAREVQVLISIPV